VLSYSAGLIERGSPLSSFGVLKGDIVGNMWRRGMLRVMRGGGVIVGSRRKCRQRLLRVLGIGWSRCARRALAGIVHGGGRGYRDMQGQKGGVKKGRKLMGEWRGKGVEGACGEGNGNGNGESALVKGEEQNE